MIREPIFAALFNKLEQLKTDGDVVTFSRRLAHWNDVPADQQPALYMAQGDQVASHQLKATPYKWDCIVRLYVYVRVGDDQAPAPIVNSILDKIEQILMPAREGEQQTLGGLCDTCFIDGTVETYEGTLGSQEVAIVPIKILVR
jgi:hypothetical protein